MSEIIITDALISFGIVISLALIYWVNKKARRKAANELITSFNILARRNGLSFTHQEVLEGFIIGLDELRRKLFVLTSVDNRLHLKIINLAEILHCSSKKNYKKIACADTGQKNVARVEKIWLEFEYADGRGPVQITFYDAGSNQLFAMSEMELKVQHWENILTGAINNCSKNIA